MKLTLRRAIQQRDRAESRARAVQLHNAGLLKRIADLERKNADLRAAVAAERERPSTHDDDCTVVEGSRARAGRAADVETMADMVDGGRW